MIDLYVGKTVEWFDGFQYWGVGRVVSIEEKTARVEFEPNPLYEDNGPVEVPLTELVEPRPA